MTEIIETVHRLNSHNIGDECVHVMIPYFDRLTIFNSKGMIFHSDVYSKNHRNDYLTDNRRFYFPYFNIPEHFEKIGFSGERVNYVNQLINYDEPYIFFYDGNMIERFVVKDNDSALLVNKPLIETEHKVSYFSRAEVDNMFRHPNDSQEKIYYIDLDENTIIDRVETEAELSSTLRNITLEKLRKYKDNIMGTDSDNIKLTSQMIKYIENALKLSNTEGLRNIQIGGPNPIVCIKLSGNNIEIEMISIRILKPDHYEVSRSIVPVTRYLLEEVKSLTPNFLKITEPKISLSLNPRIHKEDVIFAKKRVRELESKNKK